MNIRLRDMQPGEHHTVQAVFDGLSPDSRHLRFHGPVKQLLPRMLDALAAVDGHSHVAVVAEVGRGRRRCPVGIVRMVRTAPGTAEIAIEVVDAVQGHGVGRRLLQAIHARALRLGVEVLDADVLVGNEPMLHLLRDVFPGATATTDGRTVELRCPVPALAFDPADLPVLTPAA